MRFRIMPARPESFVDARLLNIKAVPMGSVWRTQRARTKAGGRRCVGEGLALHHAEQAGRPRSDDEERFAGVAEGAVAAEDSAVAAGG